MKLKELAPLLITPGWELFTQHQHDILSTLRLELEVAKGDRVLLLQGQIQAIRDMLSLKDRVQKELTK